MTVVLLVVGLTALLVGLYLAGRPTIRRTAATDRPVAGGPPPRAPGGHPMPGVGPDGEP